VIGRHATAYPDLIRRINDAGMQIENHSYTHPNLTLMSLSAVEAELLRTLMSVKAVTGKGMRYFRPPGGNYSQDIFKSAAKLGMAPCMWTVDADSLENGESDRLADFVLQRVTPGAIVLMHNGRIKTVEAMPKIIDGLRRKGYSFVTVDEMLTIRAKPKIQ